MNKKIYLVGILIIIVLISFFIYKKYFNTNDLIKLNREYYNVGKYIEINDTQLDNLQGNFILFIHNDFCSMGIPCEDVFHNFMKNNKIDFLKISFDLFKKSKYYKFVKYSPSILIIKDGDVISFLDANSDNDLIKYQDVEEFSKWISKYVILK